MALTALATRRQVENGIQGSRWAERAGRVGLASRGIIYCVVAAIAVAIARHGGAPSGTADRPADRQGALKTVAQEPFGHALLLVLAAGFTCYAAWRFLKAVSAAGEGSGHESGLKGGVKRFADVGRGLVYVSLLFSTLRLATRDESSSGSDEKVHTFTARLLEHPSGRVLVALIGAGLAVTGVVLVVRACKRSFEKHLKTGEMNTWQKRWYLRLGVTGYSARGVVAALVGMFLVEAAMTFNPDRAEGIDGALRRLAQQHFGPALLMVVAAGLLTFGLYSFVEARWRSILDG